MNKDEKYTREDCIKLLTDKSRDLRDKGAARSVAAGA